MTAWNSLKSHVLTTERVREVDRLAIEDYGMHSLVLMENAAIGCVRWIQSKFPDPVRTAILCGRGNNGGDGLVIARHLEILEWPTQVLLLGPEEKLSSDSSANYQILRNSSVAPTVVETVSEDQIGLIENAELIIDAMLGTGASGDPRGPLAEWIETANRQAAFRLAIDVPTGICADTGHCGSPYFEAQQTLTFVARKPAMKLQPARFGDIDVLPIGIPQSLIERVLQWVN